MAVQFAIACLLCILVSHGGNANPATTASAASVLQSAQCGSSAQVLLGVDEELELSTNYLLNADGRLPSGCVVSWRVAVQSHGLENYGLQVTGEADLLDPLNGDNCVSSSIQLTDQDDDGDVTAATEVTCGKKMISYSTYQDGVTIQLRVSSTGASGRGFVVKLSPVFACGGTITGPVGTTTIIETPNYPHPYSVDISCMWDVQAPAGATLRLQCNRFSLLIRKNRRCTDYLMVQHKGQIRYFCGKERQGRKKALSYNSNKLFLYFRSSARYNKSPGFVCTVTFVGQ